GVIFVTGIIILFLYSPILFNGFVELWDDNWMIMHNRYLTNLNFSALIAIFSESYGGQYSPINTLTYALITQAGGMQPLGFHLFSLIIHLANFLLVGFFLERLLS